MKLFDFRCTDCGHEFEKIVRTDSKQPECPECSGDTKQLTCFETKKAPTSRIQWEYYDSQLQRPFSTKRGMLESMARRQDAMHS